MLRGNRHRLQRRQLRRPARYLENQFQLRRDPSDRIDRPEQTSQWQLNPLLAYVGARPSRLRSSRCGARQPHQVSQRSLRYERGGLDSRSLLLLHHVDMDEGNNRLSTLICHSDLLIYQAKIFSALGIFSFCNDLSFGRYCVANEDW